jgi:hypothetical protein
MNDRGKRYSAGQGVCHKPNRNLALPMRLWVNRSRYYPLAEGRCHFREKVRGDQPYFSRKISCSKGAADRRQLTVFT